MPREHLPKRRPAETITVMAGPIGQQSEFVITVGYYDAAMARPGEVFSSGPKVGSQMEAVMRDSAVAISYALQSGAEVEDIAQSLTRAADGRAEGPMGALVDAIIAAKRGRA